ASLRFLLCGVLTLFLLALLLRVIHWPAPNWFPCRVVLSVGDAIRQGAQLHLNGWLWPRDAVEVFVNQREADVAPLIGHERVGGSCFEVGLWFAEYVRGELSTVAHAGGVESLQP